jgi:23S rRNA pseudouridine1911/1915/1917 synthase
MTEEIFICPEGSVGRLDKILASAFPDKSRSLIQRAIEKKMVYRKDGTFLDPKSKVIPGDELIINLVREQSVPLQGVKIPLDILFEDSEIIVLDKASGMVVHPGDGTKDDTLVHALLNHCPNHLCPIGAPERPGIVHRLDKETSGVMVIAKSELAYYSLIKQFSERKTNKEYLALVSGMVKGNSGQIDQPIGRHPKIRVRMAVVKNGKEARSEWKVISRYVEKYTFLRVRILTGRTHQIRVHLSYIGHPLAGDLTYGYKKNSIFNRVMLHASLLEFTHPKKLKKLTFKSEPPKEFEERINLLKPIK